MNKNQFGQYLLDLEQTLLSYRDANTRSRKMNLQNILNSLQTEDIEQGLLAMGRVVTVIGYLKNLYALEHQEFFSILPDFYQMELPKPLDDFFEFGAPYTMRLKCSPKAITKEIYEIFRQAQNTHLKKFNLDKYFDLYELDIHASFSSGLYPIPIQMFGKFNNQCVDRVFLSQDGYFNLAYKRSKYLLPGGGMCERNLPDNPKCKIYKVLEEYIEEERADFYLIAKSYIGKIAIEDLKNKLLIAFNEKKFQKIGAIYCANGHSLLHHLTSVIADSKDSVDLITKLIQGIDSCDGSEASVREVFLMQQLRSHIQVIAFKLTDLYEQALRHIQEHSILIQIPMFLDIRALGGRQISNTFIFKKISLEQWFQEKFDCPYSVFGDDLTGATSIQMNFLEAVSHHQKFAGSHLLIMLANVLLVDYKQHLKHFDRALFQSVLKKLSGDLQLLLV